MALITMQNPTKFQIEFAGIRHNQKLPGAKHDAAFFVSKFAIGFAGIRHNQMLPGAKHDAAYFVFQI